MAYVDHRLTRKRLIAGKLEASRGTYLAPEAADVFEVTNMGLPTVNSETVSWDTFRNTMTRDPDSIRLGQITASITFSIAMPYKNMAGAAVTTWDSKWSRWFEVCGLACSVSTDCFIAPTDSPTANLSINFNVDGISYQLRGCAGSVEIVAEAGQFFVANFTMTGVVNDILEGAALAITSIVTQTPEVVEDLGLFTINTMTPCVKTFSIASGTTVQPYYCQSGDKGIAYYYVSDRAITGNAVCGPMWSGTDQMDDELIAAWQDSTAVVASWAYGATTTADGTSMVLKGTISDLQSEDDSGMFRWNVSIEGGYVTALGELGIILNATTP